MRVHSFLARVCRRRSFRPSAARACRAGCGGGGGGGGTEHDSPVLRRGRRLAAAAAAKTAAAATALVTLYAVRWRAAGGDELAAQGHGRYGARRATGARAALRGRRGVLPVLPARCAAAAPRIDPGAAADTPAERPASSPSLQTAHVPTSEYASIQTSQTNQLNNPGIILL